MISPMNPSTQAPVLAVEQSRTRVPRESVVLRLVFWMAIAVVVFVIGGGGACAALSRPQKARHFEIAPDPDMHPLRPPVGPEPPEAQLVAAR